MKTGLLVLLILAGGLTVHAQEADTAVARAALEKASIWRDSTQYDSAVWWFEHARNLYMRAGDWGGYAGATNEQGITFRMKGEYPKAEQLYLEVLALRDMQLDSMHPEIVQVHNNLGTNYMAMGSFEKATWYLDQALAMKRKLYGEEHVEVALTCNNLGHLYAEIGEPKKALEYLHRSVSINQRVYGEDHPDVAAGYNNLGVTYYGLGDYDQMRTYMMRSMEIKVKTLPANHPDLLLGYNNIGFCYNLMGDYGEAIFYFERALAVAVEVLGPMHPQVGVLYNNLGNAHRIRREHDDALHYFGQSLAIKMETIGPRHRDVGITYSNMGQCYDQKKDWVRALEYYYKAVAIYEEALGPDHADLSVIHHNIAQSEDELKHYPVAWRRYQKALSISLAANGPDHPRTATIYASLGAHLQQQKKWQQARWHHEQAIDIYQRVLGDEHPDLAGAYGDLAETLRKQGDYKEALTINARALDVLGLEAKRMGIDSPLAVEFPNVRIGPILTELVHNRANLMRKAGTGTETLLAARSWYRLASQYTDSLRMSYRSAGARQSLSETAVPLYEGAIETAWQLWQQTADSSYLEEIFYYAEKSKNLSMLQAIQEAAARRFAFIPDSLLRQERELRTDLAYYDQRLLAKSEEESVDSLENDRLRQRHFERLEEYRQLIARFEREFPDYYRLKYQLVPPSISTLRAQLLSEKSGLLEYFVGDSSMYVLLLTKGQIAVSRINSVSAISEDVVALHTLMAQYFLEGRPGESSFKSAASAYARTAYELYQRLFPELGIPYPEDLTIIPDGVLGYLPFSVLLTELPDSSSRFRSHPYLLRQHQLSYGYSAALLLKMSRHERRSRRLGAFAPDFWESATEAGEGRGGSPYTGISDLAGMRGDLGPLYFNRQEAESVVDRFGGKGFYGADASLANFLKIAPQFDFLHIATHGKTNDRTSDLSFLAFSPEVDSGEQSLLYIRDLYALELQAELVVLSACESGIGKLYRGEGISSLASGFGYAGASSIITTLWGVNDERTARFMQVFYKFLREGQSKDEALRNTKLSYLSEVDDYYAHPFFWAGYVAIGDMRPVGPSGNYIAWIATGFLLLMIGSGGYSIWRFRRNLDKKAS